MCVFVRVDVCIVPFVHLCIGVCTYITSDLSHILIPAGLYIASCAKQDSRIFVSPFDEGVARILKGHTCEVSTHCGVTDACWL